MKKECQHSWTTNPEIGGVYRGVSVDCKKCEEHLFAYLSEEALDWIVETWTERKNRDSLK